jgi:hypothetical protein
MRNLEIFKCIAYYDPEGTLVVNTEINPLTPKCIGELDLRQKITAGIAAAYLDHFHRYMSDAEGREELDFFWRLLKYRPSFEDQPNPKSTENNHEII